MVNEKRRLEEFKNDLKNEFIIRCNGNDYNKLNLLRISDIIDRIYEKYSTLPTVDAAEVVRCKDCKHWNQSGGLESYCTNPDGLDNYARHDDFCSYGERKDNG